MEGFLKIADLENSIRVLDWASSIVRNSPDCKMDDLTHLRSLALDVREELDYRRRLNTWKGLEGYEPFEINQNGDVRLRDDQIPNSEEDWYHYWGSAYADDIPAGATIVDIHHRGREYNLLVEVKAHQEWPTVSRI